MAVNDEAALDATAGTLLAGRRELALLDEPSVLVMTRLLIRVCREPGPWVRAAVSTVDRFAREVAGGDLAGLLAAGRTDPAVAPGSLARQALRHDGLAGSQLASLAFGPKLWWTASGVDVAWRPVSSVPAMTPPLPGQQTDGDLRLLLLAVIGSGATEAELLGVRVADAGSLDASGTVVPDLLAEPLAVSYQPAGGGPRRVTFLAYEVRAELLARLAVRGQPDPGEPLLLTADAADAASAAAAVVGRSLIAAGNDINVTMCRATGDFFRAWGMPGARFDARSEVSGTSDHPTNPSRLEESR